MNEFGLALQFLTRLPVPFKVGYSQEKFTNSMKYFPIVGLIIGLALAALDMLLLQYFSSSLTSTIVVVAMIGITGGLHIDGLADTADGLLSGKNRERIFDIMKDSRVGTFGVIAIILLIIMKVTLLLEMNPNIRGHMLIITPVVSRWAVVFAAFKYPYARKEQGLGSVFAGKIHILPFLISTAITFTIVFTVLSHMSISMALYISLFYLASIWYLSSSFARKLKGHTGDTYGALIEITEVVILFSSFFLP